MPATCRLTPTIRNGLHRNHNINHLPTLLTRAHLSHPSFSRSASTMSEGPPQGLPQRPSQPHSFSASPTPPNPLGEGRYIRTAAALIIGDEILNGKTHDTNSNYFAKYCFQHGIDLKRIEVIADDEEQIIEASRRLVKNYDFVITSGGIGPTHDDITYACLAKAFNQPLAHHPETLARMAHLMKTRLSTQTPQQRAATERMALFPVRAEVIFLPDIWVPVVRLEGKLCVFPGIPALFTKMLNSLTPFLPLPPPTERPSRIQVFTERSESMIAPYLTKLQMRVKPHGIQVGSYPVLGHGVFVSLIGRERTLTTATAREGYLSEVAREVEKEVDGHVLTSEEQVEARKKQCTAAPQKAKY
ncbi:MoaB/Mog domain-containing protein [Roridomyces roridus]|uniref:MoaB/Mog domain-containing protein n=1 Tax=Roridomyces roridus TaxID=1738132 RepID=A0AAD7FRB5_9AGAR|nr:MoaB/Mog domain-containing protein [Roridomyces roridus]